MGNKNTEQATPAKLTLRKAASDIYFSAEIKNGTVTLPAELITRLGEFLKSKESMPKTIRESRKYDAQIANPGAFLDRLTAQFTVQTKRKKLALDPIVVSQAVLSVAYAKVAVEQAAQ